MCIYIYVHIYMYISVCIYIYVCVYMCVWLCVYVCMIMCVCVCMYVCMYIHTLKVSESVIYHYISCLFLLIYMAWHYFGQMGPTPGIPMMWSFQSLDFFKHIFNWGSGHYYFETRPSYFIIVHCFILQSQFRNHSQRILEMSSVSVTKISRARNARWRTPSYCMSVRECSRTRFRLGRSSWLGITSEAAGVTLKAGWQKRADSFSCLCLDSSLFFSLGQFSLLFAAFWS